jgi:hypothetical protein
VASGGMPVILTARVSRASNGVTVIGNATIPDGLGLTSAIDALPSCGCQNFGLAGLGMIRSGLRWPSSAVLAFSLLGLSQPTPRAAGFISAPPMTSRPPRSAAKKRQLIVTVLPRKYSHPLDDVPQTISSG